MFNGNINDEMFAPVDNRAMALLGINHSSARKGFTTKSHLSPALPLDSTDLNTVYENRLIKNTVS